ncbi:MAG TPA: phenylalanine--tRNA ligase subunit alpha [Geobacterales bacterium]|nr:phenylalanine--tRNA ligase subunit alpha [Geobacterales bacterium]
MMNKLQLYEREFKLLSRALDGYVEASSLSRDLGIPYTTLSSWIEELKYKGYVQIREEIYNRARLTEEGKKYAKSGLPEFILALILKQEGPKSLEELKSSFNEKELDVAIMHGLRKRFFEYFQGKLRFLEMKHDEEETLIKEIASKGELILKDLNQAMKILRRRGLLEIDEVKVLSFKATDQIAAMIKEGKYDIIPEISKLTSEDIISKRWLQYPIKAYNLEAMPPVQYFGRTQVYMRFLEEVKKILLEMGFEEADWDYIMPELWNFDALFVPQDHPARDVQDTFRVALDPLNIEEDFAAKVKEMHESAYKSSLGWDYKWSAEIAKRLVLRTHTTPVSIRYVYINKDKEAKVFCISRNFRRDLPDRTHFIEFYQCEGIMVGKQLNFSNLLYFLREFANRLGLEKVKFKPSYFPFTEPSVEGAVYHSKLGWVEALPGGMFRPEMLRALGVESKVLAWGIGIDRLAMAYLGIDDIRDLFSKDLNYLRNARLI